MLRALEKAVFYIIYIFIIMFIIFTGVIIVIVIVIVIIIIAHPNGPHFQSELFSIHFDGSWSIYPHLFGFLQSFTAF